LPTVRARGAAARQVKMEEKKEEIADPAFNFKLKFKLCDVLRCSVAAFMSHTCAVRFLA
jgi:hypothetical protein